MSAYKITEKQNLNSTRDGVIIYAKNLQAAKRHATKNQSFQGTALVIENDQGIELCYKENGSWVNA
jgi:hypothetical protein